MIGRAKTSIKLASGKWIFPESLEGHCRQAHALQSSRMGSIFWNRRTAVPESDHILPVVVEV